MGVLVF
jgi:hypothetical protein